MIEGLKMRLSKKTAILIALIVVALVSNLFIAKIVTTEKFNSATIESLDEKKITVMKLAATAAASATAISLIPGDAAMPIANQIAELSSYFILILGAILLEKMLIGVVGYLSFTYIIPAACILGILYLYTKRKILLSFALRLAVFGIVIFIAIPVSIKISDIMYDSHQESINKTIDTAKQNEEFIDNKKKEFITEDKNWFEKVQNKISAVTSNITKGISEIAKEGEETLATFIETIAVLIVTSAVIPFAVIFLFMWITKILFSIDIIAPLKMKKNKTISFDKEIEMELAEE